MNLKLYLILYLATNSLFITAAQERDLWLLKISLKTKRIWWNRNKKHLHNECHRRKQLFWQTQLIKAYLPKHIIFKNRNKIQIPLKRGQKEWNAVYIWKNSAQTHCPFNKLTLWLSVGMLLVAKNRQHLLSLSHMPGVEILKYGWSQLRSSGY